MAGEKDVTTTGPPEESGKQPKSPLVRSLTDFLKREDGPTQVEYAVMLALIIVVCIAAVTTLGSNDALKPSEPKPDPPV